MESLIAPRHQKRDPHEGPWKGSGRKLRKTEPSQEETRKGGSEYLPGTRVKLAKHVAATRREERDLREGIICLVLGCRIWYWWRRMRRLRRLEAKERAPEGLLDGYREYL